MHDFLNELLTVNRSVNFLNETVQWAVIIGSLIALRETRSNLANIFKTWHRNTGDHE